jgi:methylmalonyl-CoA mutase
LRERGCGAPVVLGGIVPEAHHEALFACRVLKIFGPDTPLDQIALDIMGILNEVALSSQDCCASSCAVQASRYGASRMRSP